MAKEEKSKAAPGGSQKGEPTAAPAKKKKGKTLVVVGASVAVLAAGGGGAGWWFMREAPAATDAGGKGAAAPKPTERPKAALYVPLETFTVNLQEENGEHFLQTTLSLRVADSSTEQSIKQLMPDIRSRLLLILSSKKPSDLASMEGKQGLANQIAGEVNTVLNPGAARPAAKPAPATAPAQESPPAADAQAPAAAPAPAPAAAAEPQGPVLSVLFTNFIIQ